MSTCTLWSQCASHMHTPHIHSRQVLQRLAIHEHNVIAIVTSFVTFSFLLRYSLSMPMHLSQHTDHLALITTYPIGPTMRDTLYMYDWKKGALKMVRTYYNRCAACKTLTFYRHTTRHSTPFPVSSSYPPTSSSQTPTTKPSTSGASPTLHNTSTSSAPTPSASPGSS